MYQIYLYISLSFVLKCVIVILLLFAKVLKNKSSNHFSGSPVRLYHYKILGLVRYLDVTKHQEVKVIFGSAQ